jgi:hypothetical protein
LEWRGQALDGRKPCARPEKFHRKKRPSRPEKFHWEQAKQNKIN